VEAAKNIFSQMISEGELKKLIKEISYRQDFNLDFVSQLFLNVYLQYTRTLASNYEAIFCALAHPSSEDLLSTEE
jgi:hypothetical protein